MADRTQPTDEPTMEEILASIRKIISHDDQAEPDKAEQMGPVESESADSEELPSQPNPVDGPDFGNLEAIVSSGLTRVANEHLPSASQELPADTTPDIPEDSLEDLRSLKRSMASASIEQQMDEQSDIIFTEDSPEEPEAKEPEAPAEEETDDQNDVLTLSQKVNDDGSITDILKNGELAGSSTEFHPAPMTEEPGPEMVTLAESAPDDPLPASYEGEDSPPDDELIASDTLELVMVRTLRPMLKRWMDENLPPIVERMVREELRRRSIK